MSDSLGVPLSTNSDLPTGATAPPPWRETLSDGAIHGSSSTADPAGWIFQQLGTPTEDARLRGWLLMSSPWPTVLMTIAYLTMCKVGPRLMQDRKPWDLKNFIILYNFCLVILSAYMFIEILLVTVFNPKFNNLACAPVDFSADPKAERLLFVLWLYYFSKCLEFTETLVFILRKKNNQISFLHVYHHSSMFGLWWLTVKHCGGGSAYFPAMMNSFVHTIMYTYYMLSAMGDHMRPYLWWKKYITRLQLTQFWIVTVHISYTIYNNCGYPRGYAWLLVVYMFTQKALFMNFYKKTYQKPKHPAAVPDNNSNHIKQEPNHRSKTD